MTDAKNHADFDLIVIGGGSGGLAAAKEAATQDPKLKVACFDYVTPTPHGIRWKLGGTCVNVGCIPKKLMHYAGLLHKSFEDAKALGWKITDTDKHDWPAMVKAVNSYIHSLNFAYTSSLRTKGVTYINATAAFVDAHTVKYTLKDQAHTARAKQFIIATGGRPTYPDIPGAHLAITSDDIFWRQTAPGKTLVVGGSYIALECAGFLHELGYDTTVMVRSILLRGFDQQVAEQIGENMERDGVRFLRPSIPLKLEKNEAGKIIATFENTETKQVSSEEFDTVLFAIGRTPETQKLDLQFAGVKTDKDGFVLVDEGEQTTAPHIFAVGDVIEGPPGSTQRPELTPVAIKAGQLLARRLYGGAKKLMDYNLVPTAVFTPYEYGAVGMSQEEAELKCGAANVDVYVSRFNSLESATTHEQLKPTRSQAFTGKNLWARLNTLKRGGIWTDFEPGSYEYEDIDGQYNHNRLLAKLVCDKRQDGKIIGFHYLGPNAGEITQGFALAMRYGATKAGLDDLVGIHPTLAEEFAVLSTTLESGQTFLKKEGCGGGGTCG